MCVELGRGEEKYEIDETKMYRELRLGEKKITRQT